MSRARAVLAAAVVAVASIGGASVASAAEPRPDSPAGATAVVDPATVVQGGTLSFRGTGFQTAGKGEIVSIKIDDNAILLNDALKSNTWGLFTAASDGSLAGSLDLSKAHPDTPILPGTHWIRMLTGTSQPGDTTRTLHATFTVVASTTPPTIPVDTGTTPSAPVSGPQPMPGAPTAPVTTTPTIVRTGPIWLTETTTKPSKTKLSLKVKAGALGSAGKISVRTLDKVKVGKGKAKRWLVAKSEPYFVDKLEAATVRLRLTAEGKTLIKRKQLLKVGVTLVDANGEDTVKQEVWVTR